MARADETFLRSLEREVARPRRIFLPRPAMGQPAVFRGNGWPDSFTTGPTVGAFTNSSGELNTTADGQIISARNHTGYILVNHNNVTIQDCILNGFDQNGSFIIGRSALTPTGLKVLRCRIVGGFELAGIVIDGMNNVEIGFCDISRCENGITFAADTINVHDNYIHDMAREPGHFDPHIDALQGFPKTPVGYTGWTINHNTLVAGEASREWGVNSAWTGAGNNAAEGINTNMTMTNNLIVTQVPTSFGFHVMNTNQVVITGNRFRSITTNGFVWPGGGPIGQPSGSNIVLKNVTNLTFANNFDETFGALVVAGIETPT